MSSGHSQQAFSLSRVNVPRDSRLTAPQLKRYHPASAAGSESEGLYPSHIAVHVSPAPVMESSTRHRRQNFRSTSVDDAASDKAAIRAYVLKAGANGSKYQSLPPAVQRWERRRSYLQPTESSLSQTTIGSDASIPASMLHMRTRDNGRGDFIGDGDDTESVAISRWSSVRRGVRRRELKNASPVNNGGRRKASQQRVGTETILKKRSPSRALSKRESVTEGSPGWSASSGPVNGADAANDAARRSDGSTASKAATNSNGVVCGGARVLGPHSASLDVGSNGCPSQQRSGGAADALQGPSPLPNIMAASDDNISEFSKFTVSVSVSPMTTGSRSYGKSLQTQQQWRNTCEWPESNANADLAGLFDYGASIDFREESYTLDELESWGTQPMDHRELISPSGRGRSSTTVAPGEDRLPQWKPCTEASLWAEDQRQSNEGLDPDAPTLVPTLLRSTKGAGGDSVLQRRQRYGPPIDSQAPTREASVASGVTATHQVSGTRRFSTEYGSRRRTADSGSIHGTTLSARGERVSCETERNARRAASRPYVPRLALDELNAKRELQRSTGAASYKVARGNFFGSAFYRGTPMTGSCDMSELTVSPMTVTASHGGRSSCCFTPGGPNDFEFAGGADHADTEGNEPFDDVRAGPNPSINFENRQRRSSADDSTYESHCSTSARDSSCSTTTLDTCSAGKARLGAKDPRAASPPEAPIARASEGPSRNSGRLAIKLGTAGGENATTHSGAVLTRNRHEFQKSDKQKSRGLQPLSPVTKKNVQCCVVM
ncbi:hypothetical protein GH5_06528 [Leishmania sp. Ghana 2012 LV757]|uniref:hypothetical protein n=1 Tax=Leishmania sp. Ghana 2012 LV757 TaxID=2803181 RepID=UPI001B4A7D28|nr:hypothetical protein GH5_06528 [Leishmania sp. Ghana 2012 LV757]